MTINFTAHTGILYTIPRPSPTPPLTAFNHSPHPRDTPASPNTGVHTVIFLGGLFDGLQTTPYVAPLISSLPNSWTLVEPILGSSYRQAGFSSLDEDVAEIEQLVKFFRELRPAGRLVLLGHSTGSQQIMHYVLSPLKEGAQERARVDGGIMQSCVSDREALNMMASEKDMAKATLLAQEYARTGGQGHLLPVSLVEPVLGNVPMTAKRWLDLASPGPKHEGEDDYFSSDLPDERLKQTFGRLGASGVRVCWLFGGSDEYVPDTVDKGLLIKRWHHYAQLGDAVLDEASGIVPGASHTLTRGGEPLDELIVRVVAFLQRIEGLRNE